LSYFINECGAMLGITDKVDNKRDPKAILSYVLKELVRKFSKVFINELQ